MPVKSKTRSPRKLIGRPPLKQRHIIAELRRRIVSGTIPASGRLPTREWLCEKYEASSVTIQQALDQLMAEGFVVSRGTLGTFVSDRPPHLTRYVIVRQPGRKRFWTAMENEAQRLQKESNLDLTVWANVENHLDNEPFQQLIADAKHHRLAGIIFLHDPSQYAHSPLLDEPGIPRVAFMDVHKAPANVQVVQTPYNAVIERGLDYLVSRRRRRVALIMPAFLPEGGVAWIERAVSERGMFIEPHWMQFVNPDMSLAANYCAQLLMHPNQTARPDALIIADDSLVEDASAGLVRMGVRVPEDLEVVAHCNFPWPTPSVLPVKRLGFDARHVLRDCIRSIDSQHAGEKIGPPIVVPAVFEEELTE
jgi:DNA-binding LacI/PurR family transcriptional regulator